MSEVSLVARLIPSSRRTSCWNPAAITFVVCRPAGPVANNRSSPPFSGTKIWPVVPVPVLQAIIVVPVPIGNRVGGCC
jgi:hypothetical protein